MWIGEHWCQECIHGRAGVPDTHLPSQNSHCRKKCRMRRRRPSVLQWDPGSALTVGAIFIAAWDPTRNRRLAGLVGQGSAGTLVSASRRVARAASGSRL